MPRADHHQHLLGPTALPEPPLALPAIRLPAELERLLNDRARLATAQGAGAEPRAIYTEDARALTWSSPARWVQGRDAVAAAVAASLAEPYSFIANAFSVGEDSGFISGSVVQGSGGSAQPVIDFLFALRRSSNQRWLISAEITIPKARPRYAEPITAEKVIGELDEAGIGHAIVLSVAYWLNQGRFPNPTDEMTREYDAVRTENDWVASQVALFPQRLVMACSANVLRGYAIQELERCSRMPQVRAFKLHFADANVDLRNAEHLEKVREFFEAAERLRMPVIVHFAPRFRYGREYVTLFLREILSRAPHILVQIAHLGGDGPGLDQPDGIAAFADAIARGDPSTRNLYFDAAGLVNRQMSVAEGQAMAEVIRRLGLRRVLYGSDGQPPNRVTAEYWIQVRRKLPLTDQELSLIARNVAPYLRPR